MVSVHLFYYRRQLGDLLLKVRNDIRPAGQTLLSPPERLIHASQTPGCLTRVCLVPTPPLWHGDAAVEGGPE